MEVEGGREEGAVAWREVVWRNEGEVGPWLGGGGEEEREEEEE